MSANFPIPTPMDCTGDVSGNWDFFRSSWNDYEHATELDRKEMSIRVATFRSILGRDAQRILQTIPFPTSAGRDDLPTVINALENHFKPRRNEVFERYMFNTAVQEPGETIDDYVTRLRRLAVSCKFSTTAECLSYEDSMIRDRLILGTSDASARARAFREPNIDLEKTLLMFRSSELAEKQLRVIGQHNSDTDSVHFAKSKEPKWENPAQTSHEHTPRRKNVPKTKNCCKYCGKQHAAGKCPAYGKQCKNCLKQNHFASVCRSARRVNQVTNDSSDDSDQDTINHFFIGSVKSSVKSKSVLSVLKMRIPRTRCWCEVECQLDTGASCNVMSKVDFLRVTGKHDLRGIQCSDAKLRLYDGSIMKPLGRCTVEVRRGQVTHQLVFEIVHSFQKPLLSAQSCQELGLITVHNLNEVSSANSDPLIEKYADVFEGVGCFNGEYHMVMDPTIRPVQHQPRRVPIPIQQQLKTKLQELVDQGILTTVTEPTDWISSLVITKKKSGQLRICIDPKDLNKGLKRAKYSMPTLEEVLPKLANAKVFSVLDAKDGFYHVKLDEESSFLTTFNTPFGRYRWLRMPQGISSAPEEYQRRQHEAIRDLRGVEVIADDTLVFGVGDSIEEAVKDHDNNLENLLKRAREKNLKFNRDKLRLRMPSVTYMGHVLSPKGLSPDPSKVEAVILMPRPSDKAAVQRFLGFVNYLAKFLPRLSDISEPLRRLADRDVIWDWQSSQEEAFMKIKQLVTQAPVLRYYNVDEAVTLQCDASDYGLRATLLQKDQPVTFASRCLSPVEQRYAQIEKEMLAIVFACERFRQYIYGRDIIHIQTDHKPLETIFKKPLLSTPKRLQSMRLRLQHYNLQVSYLPGKYMHVADFLSRAPLSCQQSDAATPENVFAALKLNNETEVYEEFEKTNATDYLCASDEAKARLKQTLVDDDCLLELKAVVLNGWPDVKEDVSPKIREYWNFRDEISVNDGLLFRCSQVIVPRSMRPDMIRQVHSGHLGLEACLRRARDILYWPGMQAEVKQAVQCCRVCREFKPNQCRQPMMSHPVPNRPWSKVSADIFLLDGSSYLIMVDHYSDFWEIDQLQNTLSSYVIHKMKRHFSRYGIPDTLITDNGPQFCSSLFSRFARQWSFKHVTSSPCYPRSNGKAESAVKIAKTMIKKCKADNTDIWHAILEWRNTPTDGVGSSPVQRLMSRRTRTRLPTSSTLLQPSVTSGVQDRLIQKRQVAKKYYDRGTKSLPQLVIGEQVRVRPPPEESRNKWTSGVCLGPVGPRSYEIQTQGAIYRRNRQMIRQSSDTTEIADHNQLPADTTVIADDSQSSAPSESSGSAVCSDSTESSTKADQQSEIPSPSPQSSRVTQSSSEAVVTRTRSGRVVRPPARYAKNSY